MELVPWRPFGEVGSLRREKEGMWKRFFGEPLTPHRIPEGWIIPVDISEAEDHIEVRVELPGVEAKDIDAHLTGDLLTLQGEKRKADHLSQRPYHCREIYSGPFHRSFLLPAEADGEKVTARLKDGTLTMVIPKAANPNKRRVAIRID